MELFIMLWQLMMEYGVAILGIGFVIFLVLFFIWRGLVELRIFFKI